MIARLSLVAVLMAAGFCAAQLRTARIVAPVLMEEVGPAMISGTVIIVEPDDSASRVTLNRLSINRLPKSDTPERLRLRLRLRIPGSHGTPRIGDLITVRAVVRPPGRPVAPGAFDFQRYSFFRQLGGVGFVVGRWHSAQDQITSIPTWSDRIAILRAAVGERMAQSLPGESGTVARALVTGERNAVPEDLQEAYRQAGLAHMLAISGLHMSLLAGLAFVVMRYGFALSQTIAERFNTKKFAAVTALGELVAM